MTRTRSKFALVIGAAFLLSAGMKSLAQEKPETRFAGTEHIELTHSEDSLSASDNYVLGAEDMLLIRVHDEEDIVNTPYAIDLSGDVDLPRLGRVHAAGLTIDQFERSLVQRFKEYLQNPIVTVSVSEYRSQPILVLGEVATPGVHQLRGRKTLFEVISEAGGLKQEAGSTIKITRRKEYGPIPLAGATLDQTGEYSVAEVEIGSVMRARNPQENIPVKPNDVVSVPKADLVYVIGAVKRSGGFVLSEKANMSVLEALTMAEGLDKTASGANARILRSVTNSRNRIEIPVDLKKMLNGKVADVLLLANDILFVPNSTAKSVSMRALEAIVQTATGLAIYRPL